MNNQKHKFIESETVQFFNSIEKQQVVNQPTVESRSTLNLNRRLIEKFEFSLINFHFETMKYRSR